MRALFILILFIPCFTAAQLKVAAIFCDNMVLQRNKPILIWGKGLPGNAVEVTFSTGRKKVTIRKDSTWTVTFPPQTLNRTPQRIVIASDI